MIERGIDAFMTALQRVRGLAHIAAVLLNFANVVGRYGYGRSILWGDEVQMVILVAVTFLGAAIVGWRRQHLVMDMLLQRMPAPLRILVRALETIVLIVIAGLVGTHSYSYASQMYSLGRLSDNAEIPMWMPHGTVVVGFAMLALVALWQAITDLRAGVDAKRDASVEGEAK